MSQKCLGIVVSGDKVIAVEAEVPLSGSIILQADHTWTLQSGERPNAYQVMHQQISNYIKEHKIQLVIIKASGVSGSGASLKHFQSAELRGVVMAASAAITVTEQLAKSNLSKHFGKRKVDEYIRDDNFWDQHVQGCDLRRGSREAAFLLLAKQK